MFCSNWNNYPLHNILMFQNHFAISKIFYIISLALCNWKILKTAYWILVSSIFKAQAVSNQSTSNLIKVPRGFCTCNIAQRVLEVQAYVIHILVNCQNVLTFWSLSCLPLVSIFPKNHVQSQKLKLRSSPAPFVALSCPWKSNRSPLLRQSCPFLLSSSRGPWLPLSRKVLESIKRQIFSHFWGHVGLTPISQSRLHSRSNIVYFQPVCKPFFLCATMLRYGIRYC